MTLEVLDLADRAVGADDIGDAAIAGNAVLEHVGDDAHVEMSVPDGEHERLGSERGDLQLVDGERLDLRRAAAVMDAFGNIGLAEMVKQLGVPLLQQIDRGLHMGNWWPSRS